MTGLKLSILVLFGLSIIAIPVQARKVTQDDFLNRLRETHPLFEKEKLTARIEEEARRSYLGAEDWNVISSFGYSHEEPTIAFSGPEKVDAFSLSGGIDRLFWKTGGRLSASFSATHANLELDPVFGFPDSYFENNLAISYSHPLMRNRGGFLDKHQYGLRRYNIDFSEVAAIENQEDFLAASAAKFLDWVSVSEQISIIRERLQPRMRFVSPGKI
jgi:hypothetical protein